MIRPTTLYTSPLYLLSSLIILTLVGTTIGCSSGRRAEYYMTSYPDPDFVGHHYERIAVHMDTNGLEERKGFEVSIVESLDERDVSAVESNRIIPPTRGWDSTTIYSALSSAGIAGYLRISELSRWIDSTWIPESHQTTIDRRGEERRQKEESKSEDQKDQEATTKVRETETITTTTTGGFMSRVLWRQFRIEMIDLASGRIAWLGVYKVAGTGKGVEGRFSKDLAAQLEVDGMIKD